MDRGTFQYRNGDLLVTAVCNNFVVLAMHVSDKECLNVHFLFPRTDMPIINVLTESDRTIAKDKLRSTAVQEVRKRDLQGYFKKHILDVYKPMKI